MASKGQLFKFNEEYNSIILQYKSNPIGIQQKCTQKPLDIEVF